MSAPSVDPQRIERVAVALGLAMKAGNHDPYSLAAALELAQLLKSPEPVATSPWEQAVTGLNALVDADVAFWIEPDGHISGPFSDEHIEWDHDAARWVLTHDEDDDSHEAKVAEYLSTPYTDDTGPAETEALAAVDRSIAAQFPLLAALREGPHDADSKGVSS
ncbi:hypothetical protein OG209_05515 [Streptomyces sp. NBC_01383]|uniref:hypothetical protein n=1 Tax=Streptomyces TaxID=1883 RepID=UPI002E348CD2|nr:hypothetical protein [Streptomyces brevispora]